MDLQKIDFTAFRYIKVTGDCKITINGCTTPLHKGDIIKIYNGTLEDLFFNKTGRFLQPLMPRGLKEKLKLKNYSRCDPLDPEEYLKIQTINKLSSPLEVSICFTDKNRIYITRELLDRMFKDNQNQTIENGTKKYISDYNNEILNKAKNVTVTYYYSTGIEAKEDKGNIQTKMYLTTSLKDLLEKVEETGMPVIFQIKSNPDENRLKFKYFFNKGEKVDFSKPEYQLQIVNYDFMRFLGNSIEITDLEEKQRIYQQELEDILVITPEANGSEYSERYRCYRLNKDININSLEQLKPKDEYFKEGRISPKYNFNHNRIYSDIIEAEEVINGRISIIKLKLDTNYFEVLNVIDSELRKISKRLNRDEAFRIYIQKRSQKKENEEKEREKEIGESKYHRMKMIAEIAGCYASEQKLRDKYNNEAQVFDRNHKQRQHLKDIIGVDLDYIGIFLYKKLSELYSNKDTKIIENDYQKLQKKIRASVPDLFRQITKKTENKESVER